MNTVSLSSAPQGRKLSTTVKTGTKEMSHLSIPESSSFGPDHSDTDDTTTDESSSRTTSRSSTSSSSSSSSSSSRSRQCSRNKQRKPSLSSANRTSTTTVTTADPLRRTNVDDLITSLSNVQLNDTNTTTKSKPITNNSLSTTSSLATTVITERSARSEPLSTSTDAEINLSSMKSSVSSSLLTTPILKPLRPYQKQLVALIKLFYRGLVKCSCDVTVHHRLPFQPYPPLHYNEEFTVSTLTNLPPTSALLYLPTGGGKTRIATDLMKWIKNNNGRVLFIVNRNKLILQAKEALHNEGITEIGFYASGLPVKKEASVQLATIQSLSARYRRIKLQKQEGKDASNDKASVGSVNDTDSDTNSTEFWDTGDDDEEEDDEIIIVNKKASSANTVLSEKKAVNKAISNEKKKEKKTNTSSVSSSSSLPHLDIASLAFPSADLVIIDEAHSSIASSYLRLIQYYRMGYGASKNIIINHSKNAKKELNNDKDTTNENTNDSPRYHKHTFLLGLTATPIRLKENEKLGHLYEILLRGPNVSELVASRVLVPPIAIRASTEEIRTTLKRKPFVTTSAAFRVTDNNHTLDDGDSSSDESYSLQSKQNEEVIKELNSALETDTVIQHAIGMWKKHCYPRRTIVFAVDVHHSQRITKAFNQAGIPAAHIDGTLPVSTREKIYNDIANGKILILSSVNVISEGFDEPTVSAVLLLRPTQSRGLYIQQVGRGLRSAAWFKKKDCIILDFTDATFRHGPVTRPIVSDFDHGSSSGAYGDTVGTLPNDLIDSSFVANKTGPKAWVCPNKDCATFMHPMYKKCFRCGTQRPIPKTKTNSASETHSASSTTVPPPKWATDLVKQSTSNNTYLSSVPSVGTVKSEVLTVPRKIVPGLSIAKALVGNDDSVPVQGNTGSTTSGSSNARVPSKPIPTILSIPRLPKTNSSVASSATTDNAVDQLTDALTSLTLSKPVAHSDRNQTPTISDYNRKSTPISTNQPFIHPSSLSSSRNSPAKNSSAPTVSSLPLPSGSSSFLHSATATIFTTEEFRRSCTHLGLPLFHLGMARNKWQKEFLLSIAAQITPGYSHSWKRDINDVKNLSGKQNATLLEILEKS